MKYFLFEKYTLSTDLTLREVRQRLEANLDPGRNWPFLARNATQPYIGNLDTDSFTIRRVLAWHNAWQPIATGHFTNTQDGTTIAIRMQPHVLPLIVMTFWTFVIASVFIGFVFSPSPILALFPLLLLIVAHSFILLRFNRETTKTKAFLATLLQ